MKSLKLCFYPVGKISSAGPELGRWWDNGQCTEHCCNGGFFTFHSQKWDKCPMRMFSHPQNLEQRLQLHWTNNQNYQFQHSWQSEGSQLFWDTPGELLSPCCQWQGGGKESLTKYSEFKKKKKIRLKSQAWRYSSLAQILQILRNSWYKKYTPDPKSLAGHLRADGKSWALLILLFFQRKKLKPHDFPSLLTFEFILSHYCNLVALEKRNTILKSEVVCKTAIFSYSIRKSNDYCGTEHYQSL